MEETDKMRMKMKRFFSNFVFSVKIIFAASKKYFILKTILSIVAALLPYVPLMLWKRIVDALTTFTEDGKTAITTILWLVLFYCGVVLMEKLLQAAGNCIGFKYEDEINYYLDNVMVDKVSSVDLAFFDCSALKDHLNNTWGLIYTTKKMVSFVFDVTEGLVRLCISFVLLQTLSFWMIPVAVLFCLPSVIWEWKTEKAEYSFEKNYANTQRKLEYFKGLFFGGERQEIRIYRLKDYFVSLYDREWKKWNSAFLKKERNYAFLSFITAVLVVCNEVIIYIVSISKLIAGFITVGDVTYYVLLSSQFKNDFNTVAYRISSFIRNSAELDDVRRFIEMEPLLEKGGEKVPTEHPVVEFKDVSFCYPNSEHPVLNHCSFKLEFGEKIGLVGLNGSGKSTIVKLLCRFYDPTDGVILIDGVDSREYDIVKLRALFGVLFQDYVKYSLSLRENVALSDISRIEDIDAINEACEKSRVRSIYSAWENGIDENLTRRFDPNGKELSGGQWQRVSLARAFFRDAPIVLLDEPSAALDPIAEHEIFEDFAHVSDDKSAVLISHRLSSVTLCDKILVLENGQIVEQGTHDALMKQNGKYAYLFRLQAEKYFKGSPHHSDGAIAQ